LLDSSIDCSPCRLEWRPSRWNAAAVALIWPLSAFALLATRWTEALSWMDAMQLLGAAAGLGVLQAVRILRGPSGELELLPERRARWVPAEGPAVEGSAVMHEQWPVATVRFHAGGTTLVAWPDTLCAPDRRLLRRWARSATPVSPLPQFWMG
jgi:toxin CptA